MSKELEALKRIEYFVNETMGIKAFNQSGWHIEGTDDYELIKEGLQRLEAIDNANPSGALKWLEHTGEQWVERGIYDDVVQYKETQAYREIKQALLKAQEQEKVLEILKSKKYIPLDRINPRFWNDKETYDETVNYKFYLWLCEEECEYVVREEQKLTQEEFDLLKRWLYNEQIN